MKRLFLFAVSLIGLITLQGCASVQEIWDTGNPASFKSKKSALMLAGCINRNSNNSWGGTQQSTMAQLEPDLYEVVRSSTNSPRVISAVVQVAPFEGGSLASFRFNGFNVGLDMHVADMTKGCE